jgi:hypothetical protein
MARPVLPVLSLALAAALPACTSSSGARIVRQTSDGGTILVNGTTANAAATRQAVSAIEQQCRGVYEVVEIAQVQTGQTRSAGVSFGMGPVAVGTGGSSPVYGTSITYVCRPPQSTVLNESLVRAACADLVGRKCGKDDDCGPLFCARAAPADETGTCAMPR